MNTFHFYHNGITVAGRSWSSKTKRPFGGVCDRLATGALMSQAIR